MEAVSLGYARSAKSLLDMYDAGQVNLVDLEKAANLYETSSAIQEINLELLDKMRDLLIAAYYYPAASNGTRH